MYRVVSIDRDEMTKNIQIKNLETGTVDICFDDSSLVSDENFDFMREGNEYECKIKLFGTVVSDMQENAVLCKIVNSCIIVGTKKMVEVLVGKDKYYIPEKKISNLLSSKEIIFKFTRKDLIEVNHIILADLL